MRTIQELVDEEIFIDLILEPREVTNLHDQSIEPVQLEVNGQIINLWVRTATQRELYSDWNDCDDD